MNELRQLMGDGPVIHRDGVSSADDLIVYDYQADARTQGPIVPAEVAARMRWAGNYQFPGQPPAAFWAKDVRVLSDDQFCLAQNETLLIDVLIDTSEWQVQQRQGAQIPVLVRRRRTWRRHVHLYGAALLWAEISEQQREQARG